MKQKASNKNIEQAQYIKSISFFHTN